MTSTSTAFFSRSSIHRALRAVQCPELSRIIARTNTGLKEAQGFVWVCYKSVLDVYGLATYAWVDIKQKQCIVGLVTVSRAVHRFRNFIGGGNLLSRVSRSTGVTGDTIEYLNGEFTGIGYTFFVFARPPDMIYFMLL